MNNNSVLIASTISRQIQTGVKMALGYHNPTVADQGLIFNVRVLPFRKDGTRGSRARIMMCRIRLNGLDYYDIEVFYQRRGEYGYTTHALIHNVDVSTLNSTLLALDYDGPEPFNPRFVDGTASVTR